MCMDPGVSYRNYLGTCIFVWEAMVKTAQRLRNFEGIKLVTNLKETKEAKCKDSDISIAESHLFICCMV